MVVAPDMGGITVLVLAPAIWVLRVSRRRN